MHVVRITRRSSLSLVSIPFFENVKLLFTNGKYAGLNYGVEKRGATRPGLSFCQLRVTFGASAFEDRIGCKFYVRCNFIGASIGCHRFRRVINHVLSCTEVRMGMRQPKRGGGCPLRVIPPRSRTFLITFYEHVYARN